MVGYFRKDSRPQKKLILPITLDTFHVEALPID
jgi:hypothetical protein